MTWREAITEDLIPRYGEPRIRPKDGEPVRLRGDGGNFDRWAWVWFPGNVNHHMSVDRYEDGSHEVRAGHHGSPQAGSTSVSFWRDSEPSASQVRAVLALAGLLAPAELPDDMRISATNLTLREGDAR